MCSLFPRGRDFGTFFDASYGNCYVINGGWGNTSNGTYTTSGLGQENGKNRVYLYCTNVIETITEVQFAKNKWHVN